MSTWAQLRRLDFIDYRLSHHGEVSRRDIMATFGIGIVQASMDLAAFEDTHPGVMYYNKSRKRYVPFKDGVSVRHWGTHRGKLMFVV